MSYASKGDLRQVKLRPSRCVGAHLHGMGKLFDVKLEICSEDANKAVEEHDGREDHVRYER